MSSYYESLNENAVDAAYSGWIVGAPVVCMICNILLGKDFTLSVSIMLHLVRGSLNLN